MNRQRFCFLTVLAILAAVSRLVPHWPNFTPMAAVALFGAATFSKRWIGVVVAFGSLLLSDLLLHLTYQPGGWQPSWGFYRGQWVIYACLIPTLLLGFSIRERRSFPRIALATLANAVIFWVVTNFAVWANGSGLHYSKDLQGLLLCYEMAIPFFKNSLRGDVFYSTALFGSLAIAEWRIRSLRTAEKTPFLAVAANS